MDFRIEPAKEADEAAVVDLWHTCGLVVSYNNPSADFRFARGKDNSDILVATGYGHYHRYAAK